MELRGVTENPTLQEQVPGSRLCIILPKGDTIRNMVYTGILDELAKEAEIHVLTIYPSEDLVDQFRQRYTNLYELAGDSEHWMVHKVRELLRHAHDRRLWSRATQEHWLRRSRNRHHWVAKTLSLPFSTARGLRLLSRVERRVSWWMRNKITDAYVNLFRQINPSLVFNSSHVHSEIAIQALDAAQHLGIPTATFIFSWDNLTSRSRIIPPYAYYLVWNEASREQLLHIYPEIRPDQVFVTGTPQFDFHFQPSYYWTREAFCEWAGLEASRPIVLYATGLKMPGEEVLVEDVADLLGELSDVAPPQLVLRIHPKDRTDKFEALRSKRPDITFLDASREPQYATLNPEDSFFLVNTLRHADVGINVASTISLELCMFDKPVINIGYDPEGVDVGLRAYWKWYEYDHYQPVVESGAVHVAYSRTELRTLLLEAFNHPGTFSAERERFIKQFFGSYLDGRSGERIADCLLALIHPSKA